MTFHKTMKRLLASSLTTVIIGSTALSLPAADVANEIELEEMTAEYEDELSNDLYPAIDEIVNLVIENQDSGRTFYYEIKGGETCEIPSTGLEDVVPVMLDTVGATVTKAE